MTVNAKTPSQRKVELGPRCLEHLNRSGAPLPPGRVSRRGSLQPTWRSVKAA